MRYRFFLSAAMAAALLCTPAVADTAAEGMTWHTTEHSGVEYIPLGDLRSFYKMLPPKQEGTGAVSISNSKVTVTFGPAPRELSICGCRFFLVHPLRYSPDGEPLLSTDDLRTTLDPILRPLYIPTRQEIKTVIIDPGHGGNDTGRRGEHLREADISLLLARQLAQTLAKQGFRTVLTRESNDFRSDQQRVDLCNEQQQALFLTLHANAGAPSSAGIETYTTAPAAKGAAPLPGNANDAANIALAAAVQAGMLARTGAADGACRRVHYSLLSSVKCPAAGIVVGYLTNSEEAAKLGTPEYCAALVQGIADGVRAFTGQMNPATGYQPAPVQADPPPTTTYKAPAPAATPPKDEAKRKPAARKEPSRSTTPRRSSTGSRNRSRR